jgi:hypothetical protein
MGGRRDHAAKEAHVTGPQHGDAMSVVETFDRSVIVPSITRRAVDLARDVRTPSDEGADHLVRLAMGRPDILTAALDDLRTRDPSPDVACAELLLVRAVARADDPR